MPIRADDNGKIVDNTILYSLSRYSGIYLYVDYEAGDEERVDVNFLVRDKADPKKEYYYIGVNKPTGIVKYTVVLPKGIRRSVIPLPIPESSDYVKIEFSFINNAGTEGSITVFVNTDSGSR